MTVTRRSNAMNKIYKIIVITLVLVSCIILMGKKETNEFTVNSVNVQMTSTNKNNIFNNDNSIKYIGHRGIGGLAPENTLPAFELAGKLGFWGAECDVRTTSDGNWMILHDDTVNRMTNGNGKISSLSFEKVRALNINSGKNIASFKAVKIPKLRDYLITCKKWGVIPVIEMKPAANVQYYDKFVEAIKKYGNIQKTVVISYSSVSLNELRKRDSNLTLGLLCSSITNSNINYVKSLGNSFIDSSYHNITKSEVILCHKNNIKVGAWTVDDIVVANSLTHKGVDYLTTNKLLPHVKKQEVSIY